MSRRIGGNELGRLARVAANDTGKGLFTVLGAGCGLRNACNVGVAVDRFADDLLTAIWALTYVNALYAAVGDISFNGVNVRIVAKRVANGIRVRVAAVTGVGLGGGGLAGCGGRSGFDISVCRDVLLAADVALMVAVSRDVGAFAKHCKTAVVTNVVVVGQGIGVRAHIVLAASVIADMVEVVILVRKRRTRGRAALGTGRGSAAGRVAIGVGADVHVAADVALVVAVACLVGASLDNAKTTVITKVVGVVCGVGVCAHIVLATASVALVVKVLVLVTQRIADDKGVGVARSDVAAGAGLVVDGAVFTACLRLQGVLAHGFDRVAMYVAERITRREGVRVARSDGTASAGLIVDCRARCGSGGFQRLGLDRFYGKGVSERRDRLTFGFAAVGAGARFLARLGTGRRSLRFPSAKLVGATTAGGKGENTQGNQSKAENAC